MWGKPVVVFTTHVKIRSGSSVQGSEVPRYAHTHSADGAEQDFPACDIFQQADDAAALGRGAEAQSASQCTLLLPPPHPRAAAMWRRSSTAGMEKKLGRGLASPTEQKGSEGLRGSSPYCRMEKWRHSMRTKGLPGRQQLAQEKVQNGSAEERWY